MSDAESLFAIVVAVYLTECAHWVSPVAVVFAARGRRPYRILSPHFVLGNERGSLVWANLLPSLGRSFTCHPWPVAMSPDGLCSLNNATTLRWQDVESVTAEEKNIRINGQVWPTEVSAELNDQLARVIRRIASAPANQRTELIDRALRRSLDSEAALRRLSIANKKCRTLTRLCNLQFAFLFGGGALLVWSDATRPYWPVLLLAVLVQLTVTLIEFRRTYRKVHSRQRHGWKRHLLMMVLSPMAAIRAANAVMQPALARFHPLAAAIAVCQAEQQRSFARQTLCELRFPIEEETHAKNPRRKVIAWYGKRLQAAVEHAVRSAVLDPEQLLAAPKPAGDDCRTYCPRCFTQFSLSAGACQPCGSLRLLPIK